MSTTSTRRYESPLRVAQARQNRRRLIESGSRRLAEKGWAGTSMREVAREAGVSVETIYATVGSKADLLKVALDVAAVGDDEAVPLEEREVFARMGRGSVAERLRAAAELMTGINGRVSPLYPVLEEGARTDAGLAAQLATTRANRWSSTRVGLETVTGSPAADAEVDEAYVVIGPTTYRTLVEDRGWSTEQYTEWLASALARLTRIEEQP